MLLRIGTRASKLALTQTKWVIARIFAHNPDIRIELVKIKTSGDKITNMPLSAIGGKGLFVKEIEEALIRKDIDIAVHSLKDVPAELPDSLIIGIIPEREDPRDVMIAKDNTFFDDLPRNSCIGTSSLRRAAQLLHYRPDLKILPIRGNLDTRIKKLHLDDIQAIIVAAAGLKRMGFDDIITQSFSYEFMLPAIGQGALGLELRKDDQKTGDILAFLDHYATRVAVKAERSFLMELKAGCHLPVAGFAKFENDSLCLYGLVADLDGKTIIRDTVVGRPENARDLGSTLAQKLLDAGAREILNSISGK
ncbi:MAG TPA: hydroxymethylbilane synthase [Desulfatiglandales bacterium]|nr:hydroxymethylbilane synthase [Desulfatiglandales bacterium]